MHSVTLEYGSLNHDEKPTSVEAFTGWYDDPGTGEIVLNHGDLKSLVGEVVRDTGLGEDGFDGHLEVLEALLGNDGRELLERHSEEKTLRQIIDEELEDEKYD